MRHYLGAYLVELGGADCIVFTGGIGENRPGFRADVCRDLEQLGIVVDEFRGQGEQEESDELAFLRLVCLGRPDAVGRCQMQRVQWGLHANDRGEGYMLVRSVTTNLLADKVSDPVEEIFCRGVRSLDFQFFNGESWASEWDSAGQENRIPLAVEARMVLEAQNAHEDETYSFVRIFAPMANKVEKPVVQGPRMDS